MTNFIIVEIMAAASYNNSCNLYLGLDPSGLEKEEEYSEMR